MNVALFASAFYPHVGGVEELVRQVSSQLLRRGIGVIILTNRWPRSLPKYELYEGIPVYRIAMRVPEGSLKARINYSLSHGFIRRQVINVLQKHSIDLIHVHCVSCNGYYGQLASEELRLPMVVTTHGERTMDATQLFQRSAFYNKVLRRLLDTADHITAVSRHTLDDMQAYWGRSFGDRASVIYNGIDPADFETAPAYASSQPYILGIGRLVPQKGFDILLRAFAQARLNGRKLIIAGEGGERAALEGLAGELGLSDRVEFFGRADRAAAASLFRGCDFFVLPSRQEPLGIVNLEAMAAGKAVVAAKVGGVPEIVRDGETGLLFPPEDVPGLAGLLTRLASDGTLRRELGERGYARVQDFTMPAAAGRYADIYKSLSSSVPEPAIA